MEATLFKQVGYSLSKLIEDVDIGEIGVGAAFLQCDADFRRRRLVDELDPEALQQFLGLFAA